MGGMDLPKVKPVLRPVCVTVVDYEYEEDPILEELDDGIPVLYSNTNELPDPYAIPPGVVLEIPKMYPEGTMPPNPNEVPVAGAWVWMLLGIGAFIMVSYLNSNRGIT